MARSAGVLDTHGPNDRPTRQRSAFSPPSAPNLLIGVGNDLHGDDGAGPFLARSFQAPGWRGLDAGTAPENFTSLIRRHHPRQLVIADAADLRLPPGAFRRVPRGQIQNVGLGTHQMPIYHLIDFLQDAADRIDFIGIQPESLDEEAPLSPPVRQAVARIMELLRSEGVDAIPLL